MKKNKNIKTLDEMLTEKYGAPGTETRDEYEKSFEAFKLGVIIHEARIKQGLTQEQLASKIGIDKGYISKVENNFKDVRISTLQKIIAGLGGQLNLSVTL